MKVVPFQPHDNLEGSTVIICIMRVGKENKKEATAQKHIPCGRLSPHSPEANRNY